MWPQQQQQPAQYPNTAYNNGNGAMQQTIQPGHINPHNVQDHPEEKTLDASFKRQAEGPILWFAGPPLNVIPDKKPLHSVTYLNWKKTQQ